MIYTFVVWFLLLMAGMPVGFSLLVVSFGYFVFGNGLGFQFAVEQMILGLNTFPLLAVPFFILTGKLMNTSGITDRIFTFAKSIVGHKKGGLGHVNILASLLFSGMSGSALADAAGLGQLEIKAMRDAGYDDDFSGGLTAASCIIGPLVPPSIPLVIYGVVSQQSIAKLFLGGLLPGLLLCAVLMIMTVIISHKRKYPSDRKMTAKEKLISFKRSILSLFTPVIIIGGIFSGKFTPTEAAVVASVYALFLGTIVYREINLKLFFNIVHESVQYTAVVTLLVMGVSMFGWLIAREQIPIRIAEFFLNFSTNKFTFLLFVNIILIFLGMFIESLALNLLLIPVLVPVAIQYGVDPIHFGVMVILNLMIGILTPPMGMALFVVSKAGDIPVHKVTKGLLPFFIPLVIALILVSIFPQIVLLLPNLVYGIR